MEIKVSSIKTAVTKHNNKVAKRYPLFAEEFSTTYEEQELKKVTAIVNYEQSTEGRDELHANNWTIIEACKRVLIEAGHSFDIFRAYQTWLSFNRHGNSRHNGNEFLADTLVRLVAELWLCIPLEAHRAVEKQIKINVTD